MLKVSLILSNYNNIDNLKQTLSKIEKQDYENIEIVIVDGNSTDGSVELIAEYAQNAKREVKWISEEDSGIYDAMNKGIRLSTGDIIAVCNDLLLDDSAVSKYAAAIEEQDGELTGVHSDLVYLEGETAKRVWHMGKGKISRGWMPAHPTLYLRREVYDKYGLYDTSYKISADYEFMIRILKDGTVHLAYIPEILVGMFYGGTSSSGFKSYWNSWKEAHNALKKNQIRFALWIDVQRTVRVIMQFVKAKIQKKEYRINVG